MAQDHKVCRCTPWEEDETSQVKLHLPKSNWCWKPRGEAEFLATGSSRVSMHIQVHIHREFQAGLQLHIALFCQQETTAGSTAKLSSPRSLAHPLVPHLTHDPNRKPSECPTSGQCRFSLECRRSHVGIRKKITCPFTALQLQDAEETQTLRGFTRTQRVRCHDTFLLHQTTLQRKPVSWRIRHQFTENSDRGVFLVGQAISHTELLKSNRT